MAGEYCGVLKYVVHGIVLQEKKKCVSTYAPPPPWEPRFLVPYVGNQNAIVHTKWALESNEIKNQIMLAIKCKK